MNFQLDFPMFFFLQWKNLEPGLILFKFLLESSKEKLQKSDNTSGGFMNSNNNNIFVNALVIATIVIFTIKVLASI